MTTKEKQIKLINKFHELLEKSGLAKLNTEQILTIRTTKTGDTFLKHKTTISGHIFIDDDLD